MTLSEKEVLRIAKEQAQAEAKQRVLQAKIDAIHAKEMEKAAAQQNYIASGGHFGLVGRILLAPFKLWNMVFWGLAFSVGRKKGAHLQIQDWPAKKHMGAFLLSVVFLAVMAAILG